MTMTPAGWYPDPWRAAPQRYWDGSQWTEHTGGTAAAGAKRYVYDARRGRTAMRLGQWSMGIDAAVGIATLLTALVSLLVLPTSVTPASRGSLTPAVMLGFALVGLVGLGTFAALITAFVFRIMWAWRIAAHGAALGIPAQRTPGWAIGGWFIPIGSLFIPYQSIKDSVPHSRKLPVLRWWLVYLFGSAASFSVRLSGSGYDASFVRMMMTIGVAFALVRCVLAGLAAIWGIPLARQVHETHEEIAAQQVPATASAYPAT